jgi:small subunit ribosomal protein S3
MTRKRNTSSINILKNKIWNSSWYLNKHEYYRLLQQDIILYSFIKSFVTYASQLNFINIRLYRLNNYVIFDIYLNMLNIIKKKLLLNFLDNLNIFLKKDLLLTLKKLHYVSILKSSFNLSFKISQLIEKRFKFRSKTIKYLLKKVKSISKGVYVECSGRINNVDIARNDRLYLGTIPLQSIKNYINYSCTIANTKKGLLSVKVWIYIS